MDLVGPKRMLTGLIGGNIGNSLSPALHDFAFRTCGVAGHYHAMDMHVLDIASDEILRLLTFVRDGGFAGVNVTFPIKERVIPFLDDIDETAEDLGAVNTIAVRGRKLIGFNTDWIGFHRALEYGIPRRKGEEETVAVVGAGGAGRAVVYALVRRRTRRIFVIDQDEAATSRLCHDLGKVADVTTIVPGDLSRLPEVDGIINATPVGMFGHPGLPIETAALKPDQWVSDVIYTPVETELILSARGLGLRTVTGDGMCLGQALASFRIMTGLEPDETAVKNEFDRLLTVARENRQSG